MDPREFFDWLVPESSSGYLLDVIFKLILNIHILDISCEIIPWQMSEHLLMVSQHQLT